MSGDARGLGYALLSFLKIPKGTTPFFLGAAGRVYKNVLKNADKIPKGFFQPVHTTGYESLLETNGRKARNLLRCF